MKILQKCDACKQRRFITRKRAYVVKVAGKITSKGYLCSSCFKKVKDMIKDQLI